MSDPLEAVTRAVLYEGYLLWPYRRSALKNRQRWSFGVVYPSGFCDAAREGDASSLCCECLVEGAEPVLQVELRSLHAVHRQAMAGDEEDLVPVDELRIGEELHLTWDEASERRTALPEVPLTRLDGLPRLFPVLHRGGSEIEPLTDAGGAVIGAFRRSWSELAGIVELSTERLAPALFRVRALLRNTSPWRGGDRREAQRRAFLSAHLVLRVERGRFHSLADPPGWLAAESAACRNQGVWPVLLGEPGRDDLLLAAPMILEDHPRIAPESPGDLFDGGEIDQLLTLNILAMTDEEKAEMRATDPLTRQILERSERLGRDQLMGLHGTFRAPAGES